jgi:hypothetical protein
MKKSLSVAQHELWNEEEQNSSFMNINDIKILVGLEYLVGLTSEQLYPSY